MADINEPARADQERVVPQIPTEFMASAASNAAAAAAAAQVVRRAGAAQ